jgi:hypothetical protein
LSLLTIYYLASPVFLLLDLAGLPLRAAFIEADGWRYAYYMLTFAIGVLGWRVPALMPAMGIVESALNLGGLFVDAMSGIFRLPGEVIDARPTARIATPAGLANFVLSGLALIVSFNLNLRRVGGK